MPMHTLDLMFIVTFIYTNIVDVDLDSLSK